LWRQTILIDKNPNTIEISDTRFNPPFIVPKPDGQDVNLLLQETDRIEINNTKVEYLTPNIVSLQFSVAENALHDAKQLLDSIISSSLAEKKTC
jgi:hypothetical protein